MVFGFCLCVHGFLPFYLRSQFQLETKHREKKKKKKQTQIICLFVPLRNQFTMNNYAIICYSYQSHSIDDRITFTIFCIVIWNLWDFWCFLERKLQQSTSHQNTTLSSFVQKNETETIFGSDYIIKRPVFFCCFCCLFICFFPLTERRAHFESK